MTKQVQIRIERKPEILRTMGLSNSTLHTRIKDGLMVPPISLGDRAVGWIDYEVNSVLSAMVAGKSKDELKALVKSLIQDRQVVA